MVTMTNEPTNDKRWHRAFSVQQHLNLIDAARQHDPKKDFPGKIMFDTIVILAGICDISEDEIEKLQLRILELENGDVQNEIVRKLSIDDDA